MSRSAIEMNAMQSSVILIILLFSEKTRSPTEAALAIVIIIGLYIGLLTIFSFLLV